MAEYVISMNFSNQGSRNEVRMRVVNQFAMEVPGTGRDNEASRYTYYVETLSNGSRIYLRRPANLHFGFDFLVCVENYNFAASGMRQRNFPKHEDIIEDLQIKRNENQQMYADLFELIYRVYNCEDVMDNEIERIHFNDGLPADLLIKTIKWFFIEQDIRYWNYSGRDMLWSGIPRA